MTMAKMDLAELRRYARYELDVLIEHRCRAGEDPYEFIHDLPTVDEAGVPKFEAVTWHGVVVPAATPRALVAKINAEINQVLASVEVKEKLALQGIEAQCGAPAEFAAFLKSEIPKWTKVVRESGAKPE